MNHTLRRLASLADPARGRILLVLEASELSVSELVGVVQLPQSTVSRHLRILSDEGWLATRSEGTSRYYRLSSQLVPDAAKLWDVVRPAVAESPEAAQDRERTLDVVARRRTRSQEFFASAAGHWDEVRAELFGGRPELPALLALLDPSWEVGDLGCGTGQLAAAVAPYVRRVIGVDESEDMLAGAATRFGLNGSAAPAGEVGEVGEEDLRAPGTVGSGSCPYPGGGRIELRRGRLEALPLEDGELDVAILSLVLHYLPRPELALAEAARVVRRGGQVLVVDMMAHGREEYRERMGHVWQGFEPGQMRAWLEEAGFGEARVHRLPGDPKGKGPLLFTAWARRTTA